MNKNFLLLFLLLFFFESKASIYKTVEVTAGNLSSVLTDEDKSSISHLTLKGSLDSRDFELFRSGRMYQLRELDLKDIFVESYGNSPRHTLPNGAFLRCNTILSLVLPSSLKVIGDSALYKCIGLKLIIIPDSVYLIGKYAFSLNQNLTQVHLSSCLITIDDLAFYYCHNLLTINIPSTVQCIGQSAFGWCGLTSVEIPSSVKIIGSWAFSNCLSLRIANLPESVTHLGSGVFGSCGLDYFNIPSSLDSIPIGTFSGCNDMDSVTIPESIHYIGNSAFRGCSSLTTISLPDSVTYIGDYAFYGCEGMTLFNVNSTVPADLNNSAHMFDFIDKRLCALIVPKGSLEAYKNAVGWHEFIRIAEYGNQPGEIVHDTTGLKRSVHIIAGSLASELTVFELSNTTELIIEGEIDYRDLTTLRYQMPKLAILNMADAAIKAYDGKYEENAIPYDAFRNCSVLTSITLPSKTISIGDYAFSNCTALKQILFPESLFYIGKLSFLGCNQLEFVECPPHLGIIDENAFAGCSKLFWITLPNSIESIEAGAFCGCSSLEMVVLPESLSSIKYATFSRCSNLKKVFLPESLTFIGAKAFDLCTKISEITIPENVINIDSEAFRGCWSLNKIQVNSSVPTDLSRSTNVFEGVDNSCNLVVPVGAAESYKNAAGWNYFRIVKEVAMGTTVPSKNVTVQIWYDQKNHSLHLGESCESDNITIYDACGRRMFETKGGGNNVLSLDKMPKGMYIVHVKTRIGLIRHKIFV